MYSPGSSFYVCRTSPRQLLKTVYIDFSFYPLKKPDAHHCTGLLNYCLKLLLSEMYLTCLGIHAVHDR